MAQFGNNDHGPKHIGEILPDALKHVSGSGQRNIQESNATSRKAARNLLQSGKRLSAYAAKTGSLGPGPHDHAYERALEENIRRAVFSLESAPIAALLGASPLFAHLSDAMSGKPDAQRLVAQAFDDLGDPVWASAFSVLAGAGEGTWRLSGRQIKKRQRLVQRLHRAIRP